MELAVKLFCQSIADLVSRPAVREAGGDELTDVQFACLRFIYLHKEPSIGSVAEGLSISNAASTKLIQRLVVKGLVQRREDPIDRRVLQLVITEDGEALIRKIQSLQEEYFARILNDMSFESRESLFEGLRGFLAAALKTPESVELVCQRCGWSHLSDCPGNQLYLRMTGKEKTVV